MSLPPLDYADGGLADPYWKWSDIWSVEIKRRGDIKLSISWRRYREASWTWEQASFALRTVSFIRNLGKGRIAFDVSPHHSLIVECWWVR